MKVGRLFALDSWIQPRSPARESRRTPVPGVANAAASQLAPKMGGVMELASPGGPGIIAASLRYRREGGSHSVSSLPSLAANSDSPKPLAVDLAATASYGNSDNSTSATESFSPNWVDDSHSTGEARRTDLLAGGVSRGRLRTERLRRRS